MNAQITHSMPSELSYHFHFDDRWASAESVHVDPTESLLRCEASFFFAAILQPSISHLSGVNQAPLLCTQMRSQRRESAWKAVWVSKREIWWWSNDFFFLYNYLMSLIFSCFLPLTDNLFLSLFLSFFLTICPGLHPDPALEVCTTRMRMSALSTMIWSQQRAAVWLRNPLRSRTLRYTVILVSTGQWT